MAEPSQSFTQVRDNVRDSENEQAEDQVRDIEAQPEEVPQPRRRERIRYLTQKGKEMQDKKIKPLQQRFNYIYQKWRIQVKSDKQPLSQSSEPLADSLLHDIIGDTIGLCADVQRVYEELPGITTPDHDMRRRVDRCVEISNFIVSKASSRLSGKTPEGEEQDWPDASSLWNSSTTESRSCSSISKGASEHSNRSSVKHQEAAADAAASQAVLEVLQEQEREQLEIQRLEAEVKKKSAAQEAAALKRRLEQEAEEVQRRIRREDEDAKMKAQLEEEHTAMQRTLEERQRRIQHLEAMKELSAARARMQVYNEEPKDILGHGLVADNQLGSPTRHLPLPVFPAPQAVTTSTSESTTELVKVLADALSANRIPVPEPSVFSGDPLKYSDWKLSFQILISFQTLIRRIFKRRRRYTTSIDM